MEATEEGSDGIILIVDDGATNRKLLKAILGKAGFSTNESSNGRECLEFCSEKVPQMVLLDIMMPEIDGIETCRRLREQYNKEELPIIMVTTKSEGSDIAAGLEAGANDYVTKPVDRKVLLARMDNQLRLVDSQRRLREAKESIERSYAVQSAMGDALPDALAVQNSQGELVYINKRLHHECGSINLRKIEEVFCSIYGGLLRDSYENEIRYLTQQMGDSFQREFEIASGQIRNFLVSSRQIDLPGSQDLRLWLWRDLTHVKELERQVQQRKNMDTVGIFAAGIAHNFNNIMGGILGATDLLARRVQGDERLERCLGVIQRAVQSGMKLTKRMGTVVKRKGEDDEEVFRDLSLSLNDILLSFRSDYPFIAFENHIEGGHRIHMSMRNLRDVLHHVIQNAVDSIEERGSITFSLRDITETHLLLDITDTGCGMKSDILKRVYEPFFSTKNLDVENEVSVEGNGLGLWTVYNLTNSYGGDVAIESEPGVGTTVVLTLPLHRG